MINILISFTTFINVGFNDATLEHHLRDFTSLSKTAVGGMFLVSGVVYAATTQGWGCLIQRFDNAHMFVIAGYILTAASFLLCGPMWPLPFNPSLPLVIVAQFLYGASMGPQLVGSFTQGLSETIAAGFPDDIATSAALSSLYQSSCALG
jgi:predicted MFS family arabinose efflux permease